MFFFYAYKVFFDASPLDKDGFVRLSGLGFYCVPCFVEAGHG